MRSEDETAPDFSQCIKDGGQAKKLIDILKKVDDAIKDGSEDSYASIFND